MHYVAGHMEQYIKSDYLLTDDKVPVAVLGMQAMDELIQDEIKYYKKIYKTEGLNVLLKNIL